MRDTTNPGFYHTIEQIRNKVTLSEYIGKDVILQKKGKEYLGLCPFHNERTPSFTVNDSKNFYHCFGCGAHGDAVGYTMERRNMPFIEAVNFLANQYGISLPRIDDYKVFAEEKKKRNTLYDVMEKTCAYFQRNLKTSLSAEKARQYLQKRNISSESVSKFRIGFCDGSCVAFLQKQGISYEMLSEAGVVSGHPNNPKDKFTGRITFPIFDANERVIAFGGRAISTGQNPKYLNSPETALFQKRSSLFNLYSACQHTKSSPLIVVEGYVDVITMVQNGFPQTVAALGTAFTEEHISKIWQYSNYPILCFDGDAAGLKAATRAAISALPLLTPGKTLFFCYLPENLDPDELIYKYGQASMQKQISAAIPLCDVVWNHLLAKYTDDPATPFLPEDKIALKNDIVKIASSIGNPEIGAAYKSALFDKFFLLFGKNKEKSSNNAKKTLLLNSLNLKRNNVVAQKIILGILLIVPILLQELDEFLLRTNFDDLDLLEIKEWLLSMYFLDTNFDEEAFMQQRNAFLGKIGMDVLKTHASFLFNKNVTNGEILQRWKDIWSCMDENIVADDVSFVSLPFSNFDKGLWSRMRTLSARSREAIKCM
ncbi:MAG: DNA primase [Holosporales bacterium]|jgi:DNA primase|nr:DNA primase [Holosporales bacterium]